MCANKEVKQYEKLFLIFVPKVIKESLRTLRRCEMPKKTLRKCSGCHTLIEVCDRTPTTARRYCTSCMALKLAKGCAVCGIHAGERGRLHWFKGDFHCSPHLNPGYALDEPRTRTGTNLGMNVA
jgi:hypothetical protein